MNGKDETDLKRHTQRMDARSAGLALLWGMVVSLAPAGCKPGPGGGDVAGDDTTTTGMTGEEGVEETATGTPDDDSTTSTSMSDDGTTDEGTTDGDEGPNILCPDSWLAEVAPGLEQSLASSLPCPPDTGDYGLICCLCEFGEYSDEYYCHVIFHPLDDNPYPPKFESTGTLKVAGVIGHMLPGYFPYQRCLGDSYCAPGHSCFIVPKEADGLEVSSYARAMFSGICLPDDEDEPCGWAYAWLEAEGHPSLGRHCPPGKYCPEAYQSVYEFRRCVDGCGSVGEYCTQDHECCSGGCNVYEARCLP